MGSAVLEAGLAALKKSVFDPRNTPGAVHTRPGCAAAAAGGAYTAGAISCASGARSEKNTCAHIVITVGHLVFVISD